MVGWDDRSRNRQTSWGRKILTSVRGSCIATIGSHLHRHSNSLWAISKTGKCYEKRWTKWFVWVDLHSKMCSIFSNALKPILLEYVYRMSINFVPQLKSQTVYFFFLFMTERWYRELTLFCSTLLPPSVQISVSLIVGQAKIFLTK